MEDPYVEQAINIPLLTAQWSRKAWCPRDTRSPGDDLAPRLRKLITDFQDLREDSLWSDIDATLPPLDEDFERILADLDTSAR